MSNELVLAQVKMMNEIRSEIESSDKDKERARLVEKYGADNVWDTDEFCEVFEALGFGAPVCAVRRKSDNVKGSVRFQHDPRFYFDFEPA